MSALMPSAIRRLRAGRVRLLAILLVGGVAVGLSAAQTTLRSTLEDPLDLPARPSDFARKGVTSGIARHGDRLIAVGPRGLILVSIDRGATWKQVESPVSTDLVSVKFTDATTAWAVGHDAVALRTTDGGGTWERILDGRSLLKLLVGAYAERAKKGDDHAGRVLRETERSVSQSATPDVMPSPFLDVWFADANEGFLVGAFGLILRTHDGGKSWEPWIEHTDNERRFHLYAVTGHGTQCYIAGEQGLLMRLDEAGGRFVKLASPYEGTFFGLDASPERIVAFGLRGNAYVSRDKGVKWQKIETGIDANIVAAVPMADDRLLLVSQPGHMLVVSPDGRTVEALPTRSTSEVFGAVAAGGKGLVLAGINGVRVVEVTLPAR